MARSVASIAVSVVARTNKFVKGMRKAIRWLDKFTRSVRAVTRRLAKLGTAFTAVATGAMAIFIKQSFATLDSLAKASDRLGIAADTLRGFERAVELTGGTIEGFRKNVIMMVKNVGDVATGTGEAKDALKRLRLDALKLMQLSPDEMILRIAKALQRIPTQTERLFLAAEIFGSRGVKEMLNFLNVAPVKIREMVKESIRLSGSFSRLELAGIERANDAVADLLRSLRGIADRLAIEIAPAVEVLAGRLTDMFVKFRKTLLMKILPAVKDWAVRALNFMEVFIAQLRADMLGLARDLYGVVIQVKEWFGKPTEVERGAMAMRYGSFRARAEKAQERLDALVAGTVEGAGTRLAKAVDAAIASATQALKPTLREQITRTIEMYRAIGSQIADGAHTAFDRLIGPFLGKLPKRTRRTGYGYAPVPVRARAQFEQVDLSRIYIPGIHGRAGKEQTVHDAKAYVEAQKTNYYLATVSRDGLVGRMGP